MTVTAAETRVEYSGNGTTKVFSYPYQFFQNDDLVVWLFDDVTGNGVLQYLGAEYTVTGAMNPSGGNISMVTAPPSNTTLIIINDPDITQTTHYVNADDFPADSHEQALDRLTKICQRLSDRIDRAVRAPDYAPEDSVPDAATLVGLVEDAQEAAQHSADSAAEAADHATQTAADAVTASNAAASSAANAAAASSAVAAAEAAAASASTNADEAQAAAVAAQVAEVDWKGNWSGSTAYEPNDAVQSGGSSWIAKTANTNKDPATNPAIWDLMAAKGDPGAGGGGSGDMLGANNLSDVASVSQSRTNLGLGGAAVLNVGTAPSTVAAGNDSRIVKAVQRDGDTMTGHLSLPTAPAAANAVRKDYVDAADAALQAAIAAIPTAPAAATAAEYIANSAPTKMLTPGAVWSAVNQIGLVDAATVTPDFNAGIQFYWILGAAGRTLANPINYKPGQSGIIALIQDATGGRTITGWGSVYKFPGGVKPVLSTTPNAVDVLTYYCMNNSNTILCTFSAGFA